MMAQEEEAVDAGAGVEVAAKRTAGNGKSGQQFLSFRSRKLLQRNLSKANDTNYVDKRAAAVLPSATELSHLEGSGTHSKVLHGEPTKARRTLWDPRRIESDSAKAITTLSSQHSKNVERRPIKDKQEIEGSVQSDDPVVGAPTKQQLKTPKFKLLESFYEGLEAACCLLRIRHQMCTFRAVCKIVESMSKRRFLLKHLAQIKHVFTEVLLLEYVRCQDPDSWGERWDLRITLLPLSSDCSHTSSPLKGSAGQTAQTIRRRKEFHGRLLSFESSQPDDCDIPLAPLPRRPNSSNSSPLATSPPRDKTVKSILSVQGDAPEASTQHTDDEVATQIQTEEFEFCIVKPSRGTDTVPVSETSHFFPSFRPFYSSIQTAEIRDGVAARHSKVEQPGGTSPMESHFAPSFRPSFSVRPTSEADDGLPKNSLPRETLFRSNSKGKDEENGVDIQSGSRDGVFPLCYVHGDPSTPFLSSPPVSTSKSEEPPSTSSNSSSPFLPSTPVSTSKSKEVRSPSSNSSSPFPPSTPLLTVNSKEMLSSSIVKNFPGLQNSDYPVTPVPIHTPPFRSPTDKIYSSIPGSSSKSPCEMPLISTLRDPVPPKSQGIMRSLRFTSPVRGPPPVKAEDSDISRRTNSLGGVSSAVNTPPSNGSYVKFGHSSVSTPSTPPHNLPGAPETPSLLTPAKVAHSQEVWYSPPKRTKLNQRSLFTTDKGDLQEPSISGSSVAGTRESCPEAVTGGLIAEVNHGGGPQQETSLPSVLLPTAKDKGGISESDLDVIQCLPHDIVQSVLEKERKIKDYGSKEIAKQKRRQQMMSGVPKLFNQLRLIFQSLNRTVLPELELVKTLLASHPEMTDKVEVEERLKLIIELAPDYIQTRRSHSSELLYRIDKKANVAQIQRRLSGRSGKETLPFN